MIKTKPIQVAEPSDILNGMKAICDFLRMSEATVLKYAREYEDFPIRKNGTYVASRTKLNLWFQSFVSS